MMFSKIQLHLLDSGLLSILSYGILLAITVYVVYRNDLRFCFV